MSETYSESSTRDSAGGADQRGGDTAVADRSERPGLGSAADSAGGPSDHGGSERLTDRSSAPGAGGGPDTPRLGPAGDSHADTPHAGAGDTGRDLPSDSTSQRADLKGGADQAIGSPGGSAVLVELAQKLDTGGSNSSSETATQVSKPEANQSVAPKPEANQSHSAKPEATKSEAQKPEANQGAKPEAKPADASSKAEAPDPKTLTKDQIKDIIRHSSSINDAKLDLGLGPVSDKALGDYLASKGFSPPDSMKHEPAPKYEGPSIGPDNHHSVTRDIYLTNSDGSTTKVQMTGSPEALDQIQEDANFQAAKQMVENLASATAKTSSAASKGAETYRGEGTPGSGRRW